MTRFSDLIFLILILALFIVSSTGFLDDVSYSDMSAVKVRLSEEKSKRLLIQNDLETLMLKVEGLEREIRSLIGNRQPADRMFINATVYFNAKLSEQTTLDSLHVLVFDTVLDNVNECYSASTGIFRAPIPGLYQFSLSIMSVSKNQYAHIQLMRNDQEMGRIFAGDGVAVFAQMGSVTVTKYLDEGDEVYSREMRGASGHVHGDKYCSFSGVLLKV